jgi:hypothetical protein
MTRLLRLSAVFALTAPLFFAAGCKQGEGERCQVQSDCADGLLCILPTGGSAQSGGQCQNPNNQVSPDMAVTPGGGGDMTGVTPGDMSQVPTSD